MLSTLFAVFLAGAKCQAAAIKMNALNFMRSVDVGLFIIILLLLLASTVLLMNKK